MPDELEARVRSLNAERQRPERPEGFSVAELLDRTIAALACLYTTRPDRHHPAPTERTTA